MAVISVFMLAEVVVGIAADSLALLSDAAHMLTDVGALALALAAIRLAARRPRAGYTYGLKRAEILSAQANGITLVLLGAWLGYESVRRLLHPEPVAGGAVLAMACVGVLVNLGAAALVRRADRRSLNVEGAYLHVITDLAAFIATGIAGLIVVVTGFDRADAIASLAVVMLMVRSGATLLAQSGRVLLEAAPADLDPDRIGRDMAAHPGVVEVHDLHVWEITSGSPALSAHVLVDPAADCHQVRLGIATMLTGDYHLRHTTLQVDHAPPSVHRIDPR